jgi:hypothetical protein
MARYAPAVHISNGTSYLPNAQPFHDWRFTAKVPGNEHALLARFITMTRSKCGLNWNGTQEHNYTTSFITIHHDSPYLNLLWFLHKLELA